MRWPSSSRLWPAPVARRARGWAERVLATPTGQRVISVGPSRALLAHGNIALRRVENAGRLLAPSHRAVARANPRAPTLGVTMMAQDSAHLLPIALGPELLQAVDDVVVLDGGSQDDTVAVARSLGARVVHAPFGDGDFGRQQTAAAQASRADWVLILDTDEVVSEGLLARVPDLIRSTRRTGWWLPRRWLVGSGGVPLWIASAPHWPDLQARLARRTPDLRYVGVAHPTIDPSVAGSWGIAPRDAALVHLDLVLNNREARETKVAVRSSMPGFAGTEDFYLWEDRPTSIRPEPTGDGVVRRALDAVELRRSGGRPR